MIKVPATLQKKYKMLLMNSEISQRVPAVGWALHIITGNQSGQNLPRKTGDQDHLPGYHS